MLERRQPAIPQPSANNEEMKNRKHRKGIAVEGFILLALVGRSFRHFLRTVG